MGAMTAEAAALREEVEAAVVKELARVGPDGFKHEAVVKAFADRGSRTTLYRWVTASLKSGKAGIALEKQAAAATKRRAKRDADPAAGAARDVVAELPAPVSVAQAIAPDAPDSAIPFMAKLQECFRTAEQILAYARTPEGAIRNAKLILAGSEHVRRTLETAARIQEGMLELQQVGRFHQAVFDVLKTADPAVAERVLIRLRQLNVTWGVS